MGDELAAVANRDVRANHAIGADLDVGSNDGARRDPCGGIDGEHSAQASISIAPTSASATSSPATLASPRYHHIILRRVFFVMWYSITSPGPTGLRNFALSMVMK